MAKQKQKRKRGRERKKTKKPKWTPKQIEKSRKMQKKRFKEMGHLCSKSCTIPKIPFCRALREVMVELAEKLKREKTWRISKQAIDAIQTAAEMEITETFFLSNVISQLAGRVTVQKKDIVAGQFFKGLGKSGYGMHSKDVEKLYEEINPDKFGGIFVPDTCKADGEEHESFVPQDEGEDEQDDEEKGKKRKKKKKKRKSKRLRKKRRRKRRQERITSEE